MFHACIKDNYRNTQVTHICGGEFWEHACVKGNFMITFVPHTCVVGTSWNKHIPHVWMGIMGTCMFHTCVEGNCRNMHLVKFHETLVNNRDSFEKKTDYKLM